MEEMELRSRYDVPTAAAWILGHARRTGVPALPHTLRGKTAGACSEAELLEILRAGEDAELKLYPFKADSRILPRVSRVLGFLRSVSFNTLLDVGSGRGVFLIPFLKTFPHVQTTSIDLKDTWVTFQRELADGGGLRLRVAQRDLCSQPWPDRSFDVVTLLEVLEHIPEVGKAINAAVRMAKKYVVVTVPSKKDNNPEHIHLLTKDLLTQLFRTAGCSRLHFDGVEGHLFMVAVIEDAENG